MTYTTLDGRVLDLSGLTDVERQHLERCIEAYRQGMNWDQFMRLVDTPENPLVRTVGRGWVTRDVAARPMYQAVRDMADRLAIQQGYMAPSDGIDADRDPFADEWIPAPEAAERKGVSLVALHKAIDRGDVIARPATPGGGRIVVSCRSLEHWKVNRARQQAGAHGRARGKMKAALTTRITTGGDGRRCTGPTGARFVVGRVPTR